MPNLDQILQIIAYIAWLCFGSFALATFVNTRRQGVMPASLRMLSDRMWLPLLVVIGINLMSAALVFVSPSQVAVVVSLISRGAVRPQPMRAGLHLIIPILEKEVLYPIYWQTYTTYRKLNDGVMADDDPILARTADGQEVRLNTSVIFRIDPDQAVRIHVDWQERYTEDLLRPLIRGLVSMQVSQFNVTEVNSSARKDLEDTLSNLLREDLADEGIVIDQFVLHDISFTDIYARAIEENQAAREAEQKTLYQAQQMRNLAEGERDRHLIEAEGQAQALKLIAEVLKNNPELLTYEYINKLSPNIRAMLLPNNAPLILPLQDLVPGLAMTTPLTGIVSATPPLVPTPAVSITTTLD